MVEHNRRFGKSARQVDKFAELGTVHPGVEAEAERHAPGEALAHLLSIKSPGDQTLTRSPRKELVMVGGGQIAKRSDPCEAMSPHGYLGIEGMVVQRISEWIRAPGAADKARFERLDRRTISQFAAAATAGKVLAEIASGSRPTSSVAGIRRELRSYGDSLLSSRASRRRGERSRKLSP